MTAHSAHSTEQKEQQHTRKKQRQMNVVGEKEETRENLPLSDRGIRRRCPKCTAVCHSASSS